MTPDGLENSCVSNSIKDSTLDALKSLRECVKRCEMCKLSKFCYVGLSLSLKVGRYSRHKVLSNMKPSKLIIVGQNPGRNEILKDEPFVGKSGEFFNREIQNLGLLRDDFYITNIVKCYTDGNKAPTELQTKKCSRWFMIELGLLKPFLIIPLGAVATEFFFPGSKISDICGQIHKWNGYKVFPLYHPSPMNMSNEERRQKFVSDLAKLAEFIKNRVEG
jgi:uracil-DNA glycosylase family 4